MFKNILVLLVVIILSFIVYVYIGLKQAENRINYYFSDQYKKHQNEKVIVLNWVHKKIHTQINQDHDALFFHEEKTYLLRNLTKSEFHKKKIRSDFIVVDDHTDFHEWYIVVWEIDEIIDIYTDEEKQHRLVFVTKKSDKFTWGCRYYVFDGPKSKLWELLNFRNLFWYVYQFWDQECLGWEIWDKWSRWWIQDVTFETTL